MYLKLKAVTSQPQHLKPTFPIASLFSGNWKYFLKVETFLSWFGISQLIALVKMV